MRTVLIATAFVLGATPACDPAHQVSPRRLYCEIEVSGRVTGPSADVCEQIARRWQSLMGTRVIPGTIRIVDGLDRHNTASAQDWALEWSAPAAHATGVRTRSDGFVAYETENIMTHEAGHRAFSSYTILFSSPSAAPRYGSMIPDWFDESPAVWMESAAMRTQRVQRVIGTTPSLERLVTMIHPGHEALRANAMNPVRRWLRRTVTPPCAQCTFLPDSLRRKYRVIDVGKTTDGRPDTNVWYSADNPNKVETLEDREFYALSYMLLRFIHTSGGSTAVRELISRYREDPRPRADVLAALPGLPASVQAIEREWHAFLRQPPAEER